MPGGVHACFLLWIQEVGPLFARTLRRVFRRRGRRAMLFERPPL